MKVSGFILVGLLAICAGVAQAQDDISSLTLFDLSTQREEEIEIPDFVPDTIVGEDDRQEITGSPTAPGESAAVVIEGEGRPRCSGALVAPNLVLTAAHCVIRSSGKVVPNLTVVAVGVARIGTQGSFLSSAATNVWVPTRYELMQRIAPEFEGLKFYDYALLELKIPLGNISGWYGVEVASEQQLQYAPIVVLGRGGDKPARSLWKSRGQIVEVTEFLFYHDADTLGGTSGGPIIDPRRPSRIIGLSNFHRGLDEWSPIGSAPNGGLRITHKIMSTIHEVIKRSQQDK